MLPKQTWFNLPDDKRELIIHLAIEEFADNDFESASISRLVARAGIAKGSFYQYFEDKQDLYLFLLAEAGRRKMQFLAQRPPPDPAMGPFEYLVWLLRMGLHFDFINPKIGRVGQRALHGGGPFPAEVIAQMRADGLSFYRQIIEQGITGGHLRADLDVEAAVHILDAIIPAFGDYALRRLNLDPGDLDILGHFQEREAEVEAIFRQLLQVLEVGMGNPGKS